MRTVFHILLAGLLVLGLGARAESPMATDLTGLYEASLDVTGNNLLGGDTVDQLGAVKTSAEKVSLLKRASDPMKQGREELARFRAKTPEVKAIQTRLLQSIAASVAAADAQSRATANHDAAALSASARDLEAHRNSLKDALRDMGRLAKEQGLRL